MFISILGILLLKFCEELLVVFGEFLASTENGQKK